MKIVSADHNLIDFKGMLLFGLLSSWIIVVSFLRHIAGATLSPYQEYLPAWISPLMSMIHFILIGVPLFPLAIFWRNSPFRQIYQTLFLASFFVLLLGFMYFAPQTAALLHAILHIVLGGIFMAFLLALDRLRTRRRHGLIKGRTATRPGQPVPSHTLPSNLFMGETIVNLPEPTLNYMGKTIGRNKLLLALTLSAFTTYPWLAWGALGSILDTLLQISSALVLGLSAALLLESFLLRPLDEDAGPSGPLFFLEGSAAAITLLLVASGFGFGFNLLQILLMLLLGSLGWQVVGLRQIGMEERPGLNWLTTGLLAGMAIAGPLVFLDPNELNVLLGLSPGEILQWAAYAAAAAILINLVSGLVLSLARRRLPAARLGSERGASPMLTGALVAVWLVGVFIYLFSGQPGFYGDRLFVIMKDQADLSAAPDIPEFQARREYVYQALVFHANNTQADLRQTLDLMKIRYTPYYLVNAVEVQASPLLRAVLVYRPDVDRVLTSPILRPLPADLPQQIGDLESPPEQPWNLALIGADRVHSELGVNGEGIVIGHSDSGVQWDHPELAGSYRGRDADGRVDHNHNWLDPWHQTLSPNDILGHGTQTLGTVMGDTLGVSPGASWFACVNLARSLANPAYYLDCMQFMLAPFPLHGDPFIDGNPALGAHILNNSWGCPPLEGCDAGSLHFAALALRAAGIFVVVSAGNDGPFCTTVSSPLAIYDEVFTIGATDASGGLALFSSLGPVTVDGSGRTKPDLLAPGVQVISPAPGDRYAAATGTSIAGPHVAGVAALMWSANPGLIGDVERTERLLIESARPYTGPLPNCPGASLVPSTASGYGIVDAFQAVQMALGGR